MDAGTGGELHVVRAALGSRPVIVVAHPDDETLWAGGLPLLFPDRAWTIIACSMPKSDPVRPEKFPAACAVLGATPQILPNVDKGPGHALDGLETLDLSPYDSFVTHGARGEYGHRHHVQVHDTVRALAGSRPVLTFGFGRGKIVLDLDTETAAIKLRALKCYDHGRLPKWQELIRDHYLNGVSLERETYDLL